ncbi:MAG: NADH-quinone oxidoreductase subunit C [Gemmatimonadota bacterium]
MMADKDFEAGLGGLDEGPGASATDPEAPFGEAGHAADHPTVAALRERFGEAIQHHVVVAGDEHVVHIPAERNTEILRWLKEDPEQRYLYLSDITAVDFGGGRPLEVVYQLWSMELKRQIRLKAQLPLSALEIDSAVPVWKAADWLEREVFDLFGITFRGHPDLRRIMMPDNYAEGHPLRKDFPLRGRFSRAEQTRRALSMEVEDYYTPEELGIAGDKHRHGQEAGA